MSIHPVWFSSGIVIIIIIKAAGIEYKIVISFHSSPVRVLKLTVKNVSSIILDIKNSNNNQQFQRTKQTVNLILVFSDHCFTATIRKLRKCKQSN